MVLSYALRDGDMHRKNLSVLKTIEGCDPETLTVGLAPAYDVVNTIVFQEKDEMALTLNGKRERLDRKTWEYLGKTLGMEAKDAGDRALRLIGDVATKAVEIARSLPPEIAVHPSCVHMIERAVTETVDLAKRNGLQTPAWDPVYDRKEKLTQEQAKYVKRQDIRVKMGLEYREDNPFSALAPDF